MNWNLTFSFQTSILCPPFSLQLPFIRSATQATTESLVSLYLCLRHPIVPTSQTHPFSALPSSSQQQKRQGHEFTLLTGSSYVFFSCLFRDKMRFLRNTIHTSSGHYPADLSGLLLWGSHLWLTNKRQGGCPSMSTCCRVIRKGRS